MNAIDKLRDGIESFNEYVQGSIYSFALLEFKRKYLT